MKKIVIFSVLLGLFIINNTVQAKNTNKSDKKPIPRPAAKVETETTVYETNLIKIVKKDNKYGIFNKQANQYLVQPILDDIVKLQGNNDFEYKIKSKDLVGYMNLISRDTFLSHFDDISIINNKYLRVEKENKYGIVDKKGKVIVPAEYGKVSVTKYDDIEYLIGQSVGKYHLFYSDGKRVSGNEIPEEEKPTLASAFASNLNPLLQNFWNNRKSELETDAEIGTLPIPKSVKINPDNISDEIAEQIDEETSIISQNYEDEEEQQQPIVEVQDRPIPPNVKKISVKQATYQHPELYPKDEEEIINTDEAIDVITVNRKSYFIVNRDGKLGLQTKNGKEIIPPQYQTIEVKSLSSKGNQDLIAAVDGKNTKLYDNSGYVVAKRFHKKINVYTSMRKYEYEKRDGVYNVSFNNKKIGELEVFDDGSYEYIKTGFNMSNMNKANELFLTLLNSEK